MMDKILALNNEGVKLLDRGDNRSASKRFRRAYDTLKSILHTNSSNKKNTSSLLQQQPCQRKEGTIDSPVESHHDSKPKRKRAAAHEEDEESSALSSLTTSQPPTDHERKRKRQKKVSTSTRTKAAASSLLKKQERTSSETGILGRPLWLASPSSPNQRTTREALCACGSSILYNYAYSLQRLRADLCFDLKESQHVQLKGLLSKETMTAYDKAIRLASRGNNPVVQWLASHNMQFLLEEQQKPQNVGKYEELESNKIEILRSMVGDPHDDSPDHSFLLVLSMLGIEGSSRHSRPAAVA